MGIEVSVRHHGDATEVCLRGHADGVLLSQVGEALPSVVPGGQNLVINLAEVELTDERYIDGIVGPCLASGIPVRVVFGASAAR
jgi:hypothetical protein